jgi:hypothetical protein
MYWFPDIESARAFARLYIEPPHAPPDERVAQGDPDQLPVSAADTTRLRGRKGDA